MVNVNKLISGRIYKTDFFIGKEDDGSNNKDMCVFTGFDKFEDNLKFFMDLKMRKLRLKTNRMVAFYTPMVIETHIGERLLRFRTIDYTREYKRKKNDYKIMSFTSLYDVIDNENMLYDLSLFMTKYREMTSETPRVSRKVINSFRDYIKAEINKANKHPFKVLYFHLNPDTVSEFNTPMVKIDQLLNSRNLYTLMMYDFTQNTEEFIDWICDTNIYIVFSNGNQSIVLKPDRDELLSSMNKPQRIVALNRKMAQSADKDVIDDDDETIISDDTNVENEVNHRTMKTTKELLKEIEEIKRPVKVNKTREEILKDKVKIGRTIGNTTGTRISAEPQIVGTDKPKAIRPLVDDAKRVKELRPKITIEDNNISTKDAFDVEEFSKTLINPEGLPVDTFKDGSDIKKINLEMTKNEILNSIDNPELLDEIVEDLKENEITEVNEKDIGIKIIEKHNLTKLREKIETKEIADARKKVLKKYDNVTLEEINKMINKTKLDPFDMPFDTPKGGGFNRSRLMNYEKMYEEKLSNYDRDNIFISLSQTTEPLFIKSDKEVDVSSREFYGKERTIIYSDIDGNESEVKLLIPSILNNGNLFMLGSEKEINKQDAAKIINKNGEEVIVTTPYFKVFIYPKGKYPSRSEVKIVKLLEALKKSKVPYCNFMIENKDENENIYKNIYSVSLIEYNKILHSIKDESTRIDFRFDYDQEFKDKTFMGYHGDRKIYHDPETDMMWYDDDKADAIRSSNFIYRLLLNINKDEIESEVKGLTKTIPKDLKRIVIKVMGQEVPLAFILMADIGLIGLLNRLKNDYGLKYKIVETNGNDFKVNERDGLGVIRFSNFAIVCQFNSLISEWILSPLCNMEELSQYDNIDVTLIISRYMGNNNFLTYIESFIDQFIDPISKRLLAIDGLPTEFSDLMIYAASLLSSYKTSDDVDPNNFRLITNGELVNRAIYDVLSDAMNTYMARKKRGSRAKLIVPPNAVINRLMQLNNIAESSTTSPVLEVNQHFTKSTKGLSGINNERAYTAKKRIMKKEHIGITTLSTPYNSNAGIIKKMSVDPGLKDLNGNYIIEDESNYENLDGSRLISVTEALTPYATFHDSPNRTSMLDGQYGHFRPAVGMRPSPITYGMDSAIPYMTDKFVYKAKEKGKVEEVNNEFIKVSYESGTKEIYRLNQVGRDSSKGIYLMNEMDVMVKKGQNVKPGQFLARNKYFFGDRLDKTTLNTGVLDWVLLCDGSEVHEDACVLFSNLSKKLAAPLVKRIEKRFSIATDITFITDKIGQDINPDEVLLSFNLAGDNQDLDEMLMSDSSALIHDVTSKIKGKLQDIRIYYRTAQSVEMSRSVKDAISKVRRAYENSGENILHDEKIDKFNKLMNSNAPQELTDGRFSKINGTTIEPGEILIEFFVSFIEEHGIADKLVNHAALKGEVMQVIDSKLAPVGIKTGRKAGMLFSTYSILARKVNSPLSTGMLMYLQIELARRYRKDLGLEIEKDSILDY